MYPLQIHHVERSDPPRFRIVRLRDGKRTEPVEVAAPGPALMRQLRWYLESFLDYPFPPETERAENVLEALEAWATQAFTAFFGSLHGRDWYKDATRDGHEALELQVSSDDPRILAWPWEALRDPEIGAALALSGRIERRLNEVTDPPPLPEGLPRDRVHILLVTARPFDGDVSYRSIARPLVELVESERLPAEVTVLRPPTFAQLREHLGERPGTYHLLHFDGHGGYGEAVGGAHPYALRGPQGQLIFETREGRPDPISAETLAVLLREHRIPGVVLNACQSAMVDERAEDAFASVAAALVQAGVRTVVAMAYSLYVSGAQEFLPAFYRRLFDSGDLAQAAQAGRRKMLEQKGRVCARGRYPLEDWLVPVVYQQEALDLGFVTEEATNSDPDTAPLPEEAQDKENPYGFVGRDGTVLAMERAMRRKPAGILIHGLGGVGKTTLVRGFVNWLAQTGGLGHGCFWFAFDEIRNAEYVLNRIGGALFGPEFITAAMDNKVETLAQALIDNPFVVVWDNFESACGIEGTPVAALLSSEDQQWLKRLLEKLRGGKTKILLTSRSEEDWLGPTNRYKLPIGGLAGEERWEFCRVILNDFGVSPNREDPELASLMDSLDGHPLMMRVVLPQLETRSAGELVAALRTNLQALGFEGDDAHEKLLATLRLVETSLSQDVRPLLVPLGLHDRFVSANFLKDMAKQVDAAWTGPHIDRLLGALTVAGLVHERGPTIYALHPALTSYLRSHLKDADPDVRESWARAFVDVMARLANALAPKRLHEHRFGFHLHEVNFHSALAEAERLGLDRLSAALTQALAVWALHAQDFVAAEGLFKRLAEHHREHHVAEAEAAAYHQLGIVAQERRDFVAAEVWYKKSLGIKEPLGKESGAAKTYYQLGTVAESRRDFAAAETWHRKSLTIKKRLRDEGGTANSYHQLGMIALERRDLAAAEALYRKSLAIRERLGTEDSVAADYHQLGRIAEERHEFAAAETWYKKALEIFVKLGIEPHAASVYHQLGRIAEQHTDFAAAEVWYKESLRIKERLGNESGTANTYHQLGMIAEKRRDFAAADAWYRKSLRIEERFGNQHGAALSYGQLGLLEELKEDYEAAGRWLLKALAAFARLDDPANVNRTVNNFRKVHGRASRPEQARLEAMWEEAKLGPFG